MSQLDNEYENFELREKVFEKSHCYNLLVFTPFMLINKTRVDLELWQGDKAPIKHVKSKTAEIFSLNSRKSKLRVKNYEWSKQYDFSTVGIGGALELTRKKVQDEGEFQLSTSHASLDFGILI